MLYFGDAAGGGEKASTYVTELHSRADFDHFMNQQDDKVSPAKVALHVRFRGGGDAG